MAYRIIPRSESGLPPSQAPVDPQTKTEGFVHYTGDLGRKFWTQSTAAARLRGYYNFHVNTNGWADIGYHFVAFPGWYSRPTYIFQGRPVNRIPAAQGGHNSGTIACSVVAKDGETFMRTTEDAVAWVLERFLHIYVIGGHRDVTSTSCPGHPIYPRVPNVASKAGCRTYKPRSAYV